MEFSFKYATVPIFEPSILIAEYGLWRSGGVEDWKVELESEMCFRVSGNVLACSSLEGLKP